MGEIRLIQTDVDEILYAKLVRIARQKGKKVEEVVIEALEEYAKSFGESIENDTISGIIGSFETKEGNWSERDEWRA